MGNEASSALVKPYINEFRGLDILRFVLSFAVVIWHYQHFFYPFVPYSSREIFLDKQPYFKYLSFFYTQGLYAVHIFWFISGIIFTKIYRPKIDSHKIGLLTYLENRYSRLYPLHLLMLLLVLVLQALYFRQNQAFFIYPNNSIKAFFQNLLYVQSWGLNKFSFNGPTWSVSIEILVYITFFICAAAGLIKGLKSHIFLFLFFLILKKWELVFVSEDIVTCFYFFFAGGLFLELFNRIKDNPLWIAISLVTTATALGLTLYTPSAIDHILKVVTGRLDADILLFTVLVTLSFLALFKLRLFDNIPNKYFQFLGNMTYSMYLIHFPLQLTIYLLYRPTTYNMFLSTSFFFMYFITLFLLARIVYIYFELPVQNYIRKNYNVAK
jgi:peptidoglycan/LPS O-acetylase OafA/YrhL